MYFFKLPKINLQSYWQYLLGFSSQTIVIFTFNMVLLDGKSFLRSQKRAEIYLLMSFNSQNFGWLYIKITKINVWSD